MIAIETWAPISDFPGYRVSNLDHVFSEKTNKPLSPYVNSTGYLYVNLRKDIEGQSSKNFCVRLHRLVADAHVPGRTPVRNTIDHINENKLDPSATNLRWCSQQENIQYYWSKRRRQN